MSESFLRCLGVVKRFGSMTAVDGADLDVRRGDLLALLGPSGCGKTTLLRMIAGFEMPDGGSIELEETVLAAPGRFVPPEKRRVAMVFQDFALFPHMNVGANLRFGLPKGIDAKKRVGELLDLVGLVGLEKRMPHQLSGGQQQRVALARALAAEPRLILLDEPFSNLDPSIRARVRGEVKQLIRDVGITAVFVTHDQEEALSIAEQIGVMIDGHVLQVGTPTEIYTRPSSIEVAEFVGNPNFLPGTVRDGVGECEIGSFPVNASFDGDAELMFKAESLALSAEGGAPAEVTAVEYYGHDQMVTLRLASGRLLRVRLLAAPSVVPGARVGVQLRGDVYAFPRN